MNYFFMSRAEVLLLSFGGVAHLYIFTLMNMSTKRIRKRLKIIMPALIIFGTKIPNTT